MHLRTFRTLAPAALGLSLALAGCHRAAPAERDAAPIVEKNAAARGGLEAWRKVESLSLAGTLEAGRPRSQEKLARTLQRQVREAGKRHLEARPAAAQAEPPVVLPFAMELLRPRKARLEIRFQGQTAVQVYDGKKGWKLRPFLGRREVEPFSAEELRLAAQQSELDGPLLDGEKKGNRVELEGTDKVEGQEAYRLKVTTADGEVRHVWVDAQTFLDVRVDGVKRLDGKERRLLTTFRDYRKVEGLMIPHLLETTVEGQAGSEKIVVERVSLNPRLADARFEKPRLR